MTKAAPKPASDRRGAPREAVQKTGEIIVSGGSRFKCTVHNISETGANIEVEGLVPQTFELVIHPDLTRRSCRVVWRKATRMGVEFL